MSWKVEKHIREDGYHIYQESNGHSGEDVAIAVDFNSRTGEDLTLANANLIAAAPDMFAALRRFLTQYKELGGLQGMNDGVILDAELAIAKAKCVQASRLNQSS